MPFILAPVLLFSVASLLPPYAQFPAGWVSDGNDRVEAFGIEEFPQPGDAPPKRIEGKHYVAAMHSEPPLELESEPTWVRFRSAFLARGWKILNQNGNTKVLRLQDPEHDAWLRVDVFGSDDVRVSMIEVSHAALKLTLPPPAAQPESIRSSSDFPYLGRIPGSELKGSDVENGPLDVTTDNDKEPQLAGSSTMIKNYTVPETLSVHQFVAAYREALSTAGWNVIAASEASDGLVLAHYAKNGREVWAWLHMNGDDILMKVADAGSTADLRKQLDRACHVPLYGIHFDFNQATLRTDSDAALRRVLALLQSDPAISIDVQGHTDSAGADAANQKLSEGRAAAVQTWLVKNGVAATRVTAHGFGKTKPVATNETDIGRALNRRVEIARSGCK